MKSKWQQIKESVLSRIGDDIISRLDNIVLDKGKEFSILLLMKYDRDSIPVGFKSTSITSLSDMTMRPQIYCGMINLSDKGYELLLGNNLNESRSFQYPDSIETSFNQIIDVLQLNPEMIFASHNNYDTDMTIDSDIAEIENILSTLFDGKALKTKENSFPSSYWICYKN